MPLEEEIETQSKQISSESYAMSMGELLNLYKDKELNLHPEFQRFFRWSDEQKSRLVESILLGIPLPAIFVAQDNKGKWDVVDGVQRLSTLFQLTGDLKKENGEASDPLVLKKTKYLPSLEGKKWNAAEGDELNGLPESAKLAIKRARIDIKIVLNKSDVSAKFELFDRLNTGGSIATPQEVRNCILVMINKPFFEWIVSLSQNPDFRLCMPLTDRQIQEKYDLELVVRFLTLVEATDSAITEMTDVGPYLTEQIIQCAENADYDRVRMGEAFATTFKHFATVLGEDSFRKYNVQKDRAVGPPLISLFEVFALGVGYSVLHGKANLDPAHTRAVQKSISEESYFSNGTGSGVRGTTRLGVTIPLGRETFRS